MGARVLPPIVFGFFGSSLTSGRLSADWVPTLLRELTAEPEARGQIIAHNAGMGSQTSNWGATNAPRLSALGATHILFEGFGINDCAIGPVSLGQSLVNFDAMVAIWQGANPSIVLTHQTMSPAAVDDANRTNLQTYYDQELARAAYHGIQSLNHTPYWPAITTANTYGAPSGDKLHPIWSGVFEAYSYPAIKAWAKAQMAAYPAWIA